MERAGDARAVAPSGLLRDRPWYLAPPLRVAADPSDDVLTLYTIQTLAAYERLMSDGVLVGEPWRGEGEFQESYAWMMSQMDRRSVPGPAGGLLWLYASTNRRNLCRSAKRSRGDVLLTLRMDRNRVLISDLSDWCLVLNKALHVPLRPSEGERDWEQRWAAAEADFSARSRPFLNRPMSEWPSDLRTEVEQSWEAIFDPSTWAPDRILQATTRELHAEDVVRAIRIRERR